MIQKLRFFIYIVAYSLIELSYHIEFDPWNVFWYYSECNVKLRGYYMKLVIFLLKKNGKISLWLTNKALGHEDPLESPSANLSFFNSALNGRERPASLPAFRFSRREPLLSILGDYGAAAPAVNLTLPIQSLAYGHTEAITLYVPWPGDRLFRLTFFADVGGPSRQM